MGENEKAKPDRKRIGAPSANTVTLYVGDDLRRRIAEKAKREGTSTSAYIRRACETSLAASGAPAETED